MRLIDTTSLRLVSRHESELPGYAILSHTWGDEEDEVSFQDLQELAASRVRQPNGPFAHRVTKKPGFAKIKDSARLAKSQGYDYLWVDTCCINKSSSAELSEAINSMFRWYRNASVCFALLDDVECDNDMDYRAFLSHFGRLHDFGSPPNNQRQHSRLDKLLVVKRLQRSRWFTRGWTLQELIAPLNVEFYSTEWRLLGKKLDNRPKDMAERSFSVLISRITGVDLAILEGRLDLADLSIANRMRWAAHRQTTRTEDKAYCLMGIFGVNMPLLYGEGSRAFIRLQEEILKSTDDQSLFAWECPASDPLRFQLSGMLAPEPSYFAEASAKPLLQDATRAIAPFTMTNAGLHINLFLIPVRAARGVMPLQDGESTDDDHLAILACDPIRRGDEFYSAGIYLTSLGGGLYARLSPEMLAYVPSSRLTEPQEMEGWRYIYVKQPPNIPLPDIVLDPASFKASSDVFERGDGVVTLIDCFPPQQVTETLTFKPTTALRNSVLGAFRYRSPSRRDLQVDIFVGLVPGRQGSRQLWCAQQQVSDRRTLQQTATHFDSSPFTKRGSQFRQDQHSFFDLSARVETVRSYSRTNIHLSLSYIIELPDMAYLNDMESHSWIYRHQGVLTVFQELDVPRLGTEDDGVVDVRNWDRYSADAVIQQFMEPLVVEDAFEVGQGLNTLMQQSRIRVAHDKSRTSLWKNRLEFSEVVELARSTEICLEKSQEVAPDSTDGEAVRLYHSLLLARACIKNDAEAAAGILASPLSGATVEVQTCLKDPPAPPAWHSFFRGFKPIHWAAVFGNTDILPVLLKHGADMFSTTGFRLTSAHLAVLTGNVDFLRRLFEISSTSWEEEENMFETREPLVHLVAAYVKSDGVADILDHFMKAVELDGTSRWTNEWRNSLRETPLHRSAAMGNIAAVEAILSRAITSNIDPRDRRERTPLWHACATGEHEVVGIFLRHLADPNTKDVDEMSALEAACRGGHAKVVDLLIEHGAQILPDLAFPPRLSLVHLAAISGDVSTIVTLIQNHKEDVTRVVKFHQPDSGSTSAVTPLVIAVANGWSDCVRVLCEAGCSRHLPSDAQLLAIPLVNDRSSQPRVSVIRSKSLVQVAEFYGRHTIAAHLQVLAHNEEMRSMGSIRRNDLRPSWESW